MKIGAAVALSVSFAASGFVQAQSVWIHELTADEVQAAVAAGKTTAIYYTAGIHANDAWVVHGKHLIPVDGEVDHRMIPEYLTTQNVPAKIQTPVDLGFVPRSRGVNLLALTAPGRLRAM